MACTAPEHDQCDPDSCLPAKLAYWREERSLAVAIGSVNGVLQGPEGRKAFHGDHPDGGTINERRQTMIAQARARGIDPVPV